MIVSHERVMKVNRDAICAIRNSEKFAQVIFALRENFGR